METRNPSLIRIAAFGLVCGLAGAALAFLLLRRDSSVPRIVANADSEKGAIAGNATPAQAPAKPVGADASGGEDTSNQSNLPLISDSEVERRAFLNFPELERATRMNIRRRVDQAYGDLETVLAIDAATAKRLIELLAEKEWSSLKTEHRLAEQGVSRSFPEHKEAMAESAQRYNEQIKELLAGEKSELLTIAPSIQRFSLEIQNTYSSDFRAIDEPLTDAQSRALAVVMAVNLNREFWRTHGDGPAPDRKYLFKSEAAVLKDAREFLSEKQVLVLQSAFEDRRIEHYYRTKRLGEGSK